MTVTRLSERRERWRWRRRRGLAWAIVRTERPRVGEAGAVAARRARPDLAAAGHDARIRALRLQVDDVDHVAFGAAVDAPCRGAVR